MKPLVDIIPPIWRKRLYAALSALLTAYGIWQAAQGDWEQFAVSLGSAAVTTLAAANTDTNDWGG